MTKFVYNNSKNASINHIFFKLNYKYYLFIFYKKNLDFYFKVKKHKKIVFQVSKLNSFLLIKFLSYPKTLKISLY